MALWRGQTEGDLREPTTFMNAAQNEKSPIFWPLDSDRKGSDFSIGARITACKSSRAHFPLCYIKGHGNESSGPKKMMMAKRAMWRESQLRPKDENDENDDADDDDVDDD